MILKFLIRVAGWTVVPLTDVGEEEREWMSSAQGYLFEVLVGPSRRDIK